MIRINISEQFPISVALLNENIGQLVSGETVYYDIRDIDDTSLSPPVSGTLNESVVEAGVYKTVISIPESGSFVCYAACSGFATNTEEIIVNSEDIYELTKQNRPYNIYVEDVQRTSVIPTASQTARNVPLTKTDYIITKIKDDGDEDWSSVTTSGVVYAWYNSGESIPYKMSGSS